MRHATHNFSQDFRTISRHTQGKRWQDEATDRILAEGIRPRRFARADMRLLGSLALAGCILAVMGTGLRRGTLPGNAEPASMLVEKTEHGVRLQWLPARQGSAYDVVVQFRRPGFEAKRIIPLIDASSVEIPDRPGAPDLQLFHVVPTGSRAAGSRAERGDART